MRFKILAVLALSALALAAPVAAHHSHGNYTDGTIDIEGVVKEVHLVVPHSYIYVDVTKGSTTDTWALEATGPGGLLKVGVKVNDLQPGDPVKVRCHLLKDGSPGCLLGFVTPMHGDAARGHGVEKDWDGGGGAGFPTTSPYTAP